MVGTLNGDYYDIFRKIKKNKKLILKIKMIGIAWGLTSSALMVKRRSPLWILPGSCCRIYILIDLIGVLAFITHCHGYVFRSPYDQLFSYLCDLWACLILIFFTLRSSWDSWIIFCVLMISMLGLRHRLCKNTLFCFVSG